MIHRFMFTMLPMAIVALVMICDLPANEVFRGTIVETADNYVTVKVINNARWETFIIEPETVITLNGAPATIHELLPNFRVEVVAEQEGDTWFAQTVDATSAFAHEVPHFRSDFSYISVDLFLEAY